MDIKRRAARVIAILAVALGAGHFVQNMGKDAPPAPKRVASTLEEKPANVEPVVAGPETPAAPALAVTAAAPSLPEAPLAKPAEPVEAKVAPVEEPATLAAPETASVTQDPPPAPAATAEVAPALPIETTEAPLADAASETVAAACDITLDLTPEPSAMIGLSLLAPCNPDERVVLRHGGLAVTGQTMVSGGLFTALPAFETPALVEVVLGDGTRVSATLDLPELAGLRRFGVQYQGDDAFQVHAFEGGADYGAPGHVSAADPHRPVAGQPAVGGFLTLAGDSTVENPLLAEVYTFPADPAQQPEVIIEAAVTDLTCGRELIGETLASFGGTAFVTDLTLAMPDCDAVGDYLVLKNLVPDMNMAAVN